MPQPSAAPRQTRMSQHIPASTILATTTQELGTVQEDSTPVSVTYAPEATITGAASPASRTLTLVNRGQTGVGTTVLATLALLGGVVAAVDDEIAFTLTAVAADLLITKGDELIVTSAPVGGTGLVDPGGMVTVVLTRR